MFDEDDGIGIGSKSVWGMAHGREADDRSFLERFFLKMLCSAVEGGDAVQGGFGIGWGLGRGM